MRESESRQRRAKRRGKESEWDCSIWEFCVWWCFSCSYCCCCFCIVFLSLYNSLALDFPTPPPPSPLFIDCRCVCLCLDDTFRICYRTQIRFHTCSMCSYFFSLVLILRSKHKNAKYQYRIGNLSLFALGLIPRPTLPLFSSTIFICIRIWQNRYICFRFGLWISANAFAHAPSDDF